jgi:hypothetical protein
VELEFHCNSYLPLITLLSSTYNAWVLLL